MKNRLCRFSLVVAMLFLTSQLLGVSAAFAKGGGRSFSSRSSSRSSSSSSSKGSSFSSAKSPSKTSYSSRSAGKSGKGSFFNFGPKKTSRGTSLADAAKKADSKSKFASSAKGAAAPQTYREVVSANKPLSNALTKQNIETRTVRRTTYYNSYQPVNTYYRYTPAVMIYNDPFDNFFFQYVTVTWMFHHWDHVDKSRFDEARLRELEAKVAQMEKEGVQRDPNYVEPGADPDLQYSDEELANLQEAKEVAELEAAPASSGFGWLAMLLVAIAVGGGIYFVAVRRY